MQFSSPVIASRHAIGALLEDFVWQRRYLPANVRPLVFEGELPLCLQALATSVDPLSSWRAWADRGRFWFVVARLCNPHRAPAALLALEIYFFDLDGRPVAAGKWALRPDGRWVLRRVIDLSKCVRAAGRLGHPAFSATVQQRHPMRRCA